MFYVKIQDRSKIQFSFWSKILTLLKFCFYWRCYPKCGRIKTICVPKILFLPSEIFNIILWFELCWLKYDTLFFAIYSIVYNYQSSLIDMDVNYKESNTYRTKIWRLFSFVKNCRLNSSRKLLVWNHRTVSNTLWI